MPGTQHLVISKISTTLQISKFTFGSANSWNSPLSLHRHEPDPGDPLSLVRPIPSGHPPGSPSPHLLSCTHLGHQGTISPISAADSQQNDLQQDGASLAPRLIDQRDLQQDRTASSMSPRPHFAIDPQLEDLTSGPSEWTSQKTKHKPGSALNSTDTESDNASKSQTGCESAASATCFL